MSLLSILGGFETRQKQIFHIFGTREKIRIFFFQEKSGFFGKNRYFIGKYRYLSEKSAIFCRFFAIRFFHCKIFSRPTEIRFFSEKSVDFGDFFVPGCNRTKRFVIRSELGSVKARLNSFIKLTSRAQTPFLGL